MSCLRVAFVFSFFLKLFPHPADPSGSYTSFRIAGPRTKARIGVRSGAVRCGAQHSAGSMLSGAFCWMGEYQIEICVCN